MVVTAATAGEGSAMLEGSLDNRGAQPVSPDRPSSAWFIPFFRQLGMTVVACLAGLASGMVHAFPAVAVGRWEETGFVMTTAQVTLFASTPMVVAVVVCVVAGMLVERVGVRRSLLGSAVLSALTWIMVANVSSFSLLLQARILQGITASVNMVVITVYPVEVSEVCWRGIMVSMSEASVILGALFTYVGGLFLHPTLLAYIFAASFTIHLFAIYFLRESPLWLARQDRRTAAGEMLKYLRGPSVDTAAELDNIMASVHSDRIHKPRAHEQLIMLRKMVYLKPIILCLLVLMFKELTGQYALLAYTVRIFKMAGSTLDPYLCAVVMGAVRFLPCILSWVLIERLPRRLLLCICMSVSALSLAILGILLLVYNEGLPPSLGWIPVVCLSIFTLAFGSGVGTTSWTLVAELLPSQVRTVGAGIINTVFSLFLFLVGLTFPYQVQLVSMGGTFVFYAVCTMLGIVFVVTCLPETKGRSFKDIQESLDTRQQSSIA